MVSVGSNPATDRNVSVIFFLADFSTFSYLKLAKHSFWGCSQTIWTKKGEGKAFLPHVFNDLVHSADHPPCLTILLIYKIMKIMKKLLEFY